MEGDEDMVLRRTMQDASAHALQAQAVSAAKVVRPSGLKGGEAHMATFSSNEKAPLEG